MTSGIDTWAFDFNAINSREHPNFEDASVVQQAFDENLQRLAGLEDIGFEGVFFSEHHFLNGLSPAPNLLVAALAKMTSRMKLGVLGNVLPFHEPWKLAEELAMLDYLTDGRLEIGMSSGVPPEFLFVDIAEAEVRPRYNEILDFLDTAADNKYVSADGEHYQFTDVPVMPRLRPEARRRHWVSAYSGGTCSMAARRNYKAATAFQSKEKAKEAFDAYRATCDEIGREHSANDLGVRRQILICDSAAQAAELNEELIGLDRARIGATFSEVMKRMMKASGQEMPEIPEGVMESGVMDAASVVDTSAPPAGGPPGGAPDPYEMMQICLEDEFIHGTPEQVTEWVIEQMRFVGAGNLIAYHSPSMTQAELDTHYAHFASIIPTLQSAEVAAPELVG